MKNFDLHPPLDLIEIREKLTALRSLHSGDKRITREINNLIGKLAYLHVPESRKHEEKLIKAIATAIQHVDEILCDGAVIPGKID